MENTPRRPTKNELIKLLNEALVSGELKIQTAFIYAKKLAPKGHTWYRIKYRVGGKMMYDGAYLINHDAVKALEEKTVPFLISQLAKQL